MKKKNSAIYISTEASTARNLQIRYPTLGNNDERGYLYKPKTTWGSSRLSLQQQQQQQQQHQQQQQQQSNEYLKTCTMNTEATQGFTYEEVSNSSDLKKPVFQHISLLFPSNQQQQTQHQQQQQHKENLTSNLTAILQSTRLSNRFSISSKPPLTSRLSINSQVFTTTTIDPDRKPPFSVGIANSQRTSSINSNNLQKSQVVIPKNLITCVNPSTKFTFFNPHAKYEKQSSSSSLRKAFKSTVTAYQLQQQQQKELQQQQFDHSKSYLCQAEEAYSEQQLQHDQNNSLQQQQQQQVDKEGVRISNANTIPQSTMKQPKPLDPFSSFARNVMKAQQLQSDYNSFVNGYDTLGNCDENQSINGMEVARKIMNKSMSSVIKASNCCGCGPKSSGSRTCRRAHEWLNAMNCQNKEEDLKEIYYKMLAESRDIQPDTSILQQIERDLGRTYPDIAFFGATGNSQAGVVQLNEGLTILKNVLIAFAMYEMQIGYVQGMNFIAAHFVYHAEEHIAFWLLVNCFERFELRDLFLPNLPGLQKHSFVLNEILMKTDTELATHLVENGISSEMYITPWLFSFFGMMIPLPYLDEFLDYMLKEGWCFFYRFILSFLKDNKEEILASESFEIMAIINSKNNRISNMQYKPTKEWTHLFQDAQKIKLAPSTIENMINSYLID